MANSRLALVLLVFLAAPRLLLAQGVPQGPEFRVNTYTTLGQLSPSVASDAAGNFVVAWMDASQDGSGYGIFAQRYASAGAPLGGEFRVNSYNTGDQETPSVAFDSTGNFVVTWLSAAQDGSGGGIFAQRYDATGTPLGAEFLVNVYTTGAQTLPAVASDSAGNFVVTWSSNGQDGSGPGIFAQRYASAGIPLGGEFRVNTYTTGIQSVASVVSDSAGNFVVAWHSFSQDGSGYGVFAQRYASTGAPLGGEFRVNTFTASEQRDPKLSSDSAGNFVVAWWSIGQDGNFAGVYAQRYNMIVPVELQDFRVE